MLFFSWAFISIAVVIGFVFFVGLFIYVFVNILKNERVRHFKTSIKKEH